MGRSISRWHRLWLLVGIGVAAFLTPAARADDPVEVLKKTLKDKRWTEAEKETAKLRTLSELRRGYFFLSEWTRDLDPDPKKDGPQKEKLDRLRSDIANKLVERIKGSVKTIDASVLSAADREIGVNRKIAACILVAEIAEADLPDERGKDGKFASRFSDILLGLLARDKGVYRERVGVRQAALHALGKITPPPEQAMPALTAVLNGDELGPRLLAAYALTDLVKNAAFLPRKEEMATMNAALAEAARVLAKSDQDEQIRGYCLQTIQTSARIFTDYRWTNRFDLKGADRRSIIHFDVVDKKQVLHADLQKLLKTWQDAMPSVLSCLAEERSPPKIKLTALDTLSQIIAARVELCEKLQEQRDEEAPSRAALLAEFNAPDPIKPLLDNKKWLVIPILVQQSKDERFKRGVMSLLERVAKDVEKTQPQDSVQHFVEEVTSALADPDRYVRWSAARTLGNISPKYMNGNVFEALGRMLVDPTDLANPANPRPTLRDPDLSAAAAAAIERLADAPGAPKGVGSLSSAIADPSMDGANRIAAMKALVAIGAATPKDEDKLLREYRQKEANKAFPQVTSAVGSDDAAVRREACMTLGLLGNPGRKDYYDDALRALRKAMSDDDTEIRLNASEAILTITPPPR